MSEPEITMDEVIAELTKKTRDVHGFTAQDLADKLGCTIEHARSKLRKLFREGRLVQSGTRASVTINGRTCHIPCYALIGGKSKKKK